MEIAGQSVSTTAGADGKWLVRLAPMKAGGPFTLTIAGKNKLVLTDILVGEVWVCGGQSNMERQLGLRVGQQPIVNWEKEAAAANYPQIRHFGVAQEKSLTPLETVKGQWDVATPEAVKDFTAVGYFFGRDLHLARHVPIGLIHASWGGTPAEAWTSEAGLRPLPDFADTPEQLEILSADPAAARRQYEARLETWFIANDTGSAEGRSWRDPALDAGAWKTMKLPTLWEDAGEPDLNGVVWFRKTFDLPASAANAAAELQLGMVDDIDTTWVNGVKVGSTFGYNVVRKYPVPVGVLKPGRNVVAVRVLDTGGGGGIWGDQKLQLVFKGRLPPKGCARRRSVPLRVGVNRSLGPVAIPDRDEPAGRSAAADGRHRRRHDAHHPLQRDDRAAPPLRHSRRDLVSGRGQRASRAAVPLTVPRPDRRLAAGLGPGAPVPLRSDRALPRHDARAPRGPAPRLAAHAEDGDGRDDRLRRRERHPSPAQTAGRRAAGPGGAGAGLRRADRILRARSSTR